MSVQTNHSVGLQQIFRRVCKIAKSDYSLRHVCPSARPPVCTSGTTQLPLNGFL